MKPRAFTFTLLLLAAVWTGLTGLTAAQPPPAPIEPPVVVPGAPLPSPDADDEDENASQATPPLIEFQGDPVDLVLRTLARQAKINLVISDRVTDNGGTVTMRLEEKTPKAALEIIVQSKGFTLDEFDGVYFVKTTEDIMTEPVERQLDRLKKTMVGPLAQFKGEYHRKLVEAGVPPATASDMVLREEMTGQIIEPQLTKSVKAQTRSAARASGSDDDRSLLQRLGFEGLDAWLTLGAMGVASLTYLPTFLLHVALAIAVCISARRMRKAGEALSFFPPFLWACATLVGGVFVAALYWLMHHSSLRRTPTRKGEDAAA